jgi:hypothetical protein
MVTILVLFQSAKTESVVQVHDLFRSSEILGIHEISEKLWLVVWYFNRRF